MTKERELTELEQQFVKEAEAGYFLVDYDLSGAPCAMGAPDTKNLFTMDVDEEADGPDSAIYTLHSNC